MKVTVDLDKCIKNGVCIGIAPEVFDFAMSGELTVLQPNPPEELREQVEDAVRSCPMGALAVDD